MNNRENRIAYCSMNREKYSYSADQKNLVYTFFSVGIQGIITKVIIYEKIEDGIYNLAFGDYDHSTGDINDKVISNNGDTVKVLATVIQTIQDFFENYPEAVLFIQGSTPTRTKLYTKIIRDNINDIETDFQVMALKIGGSVLEMPNFTEDYTKFAIIKK